jgi:hypothetical protein
MGLTAPEKGQPYIEGDNWKIWIEDGREGWLHDGWDFTALRMLNSEFPVERLVDEYDGHHTITWATRFGPLFHDALEFLAKWGIKAEGVNIPESGGEIGTID